LRYLRIQEHSLYHSDGHDLQLEAPISHLHDDLIIQKKPSTLHVHGAHEAKLHKASLNYECLKTEGQIFFYKISNSRKYINLFKVLHKILNQRKNNHNLAIFFSNPLVSKTTEIY